MELILIRTSSITKKKTDLLKFSRYIYRMGRHGLFMVGFQQVIYAWFKKQMCKAGTILYCYLICRMRGRVDRASARIVKLTGSIPRAIDFFLDPK